MSKQCSLTLVSHFNKVRFNNFYWAFLCICKYKICDSSAMQYASNKVYQQLKKTRWCRIDIYTRICRYGIRRGAKTTTLITYITTEWQTDWTFITLPTHLIGPGGGYSLLYNEMFPSFIYLCCIYITYNTICTPPPPIHPFLWNYNPSGLLSITGYKKSNCYRTCCFFIPHSQTYTVTFSIVFLYFCAIKNVFSL